VLEEDRKTTRVNSDGDQKTEMITFNPLKQPQFKVIRPKNGDSGGLTVKPFVESSFLSKVQDSSRFVQKQVQDY